MSFNLAHITNDKLKIELERQRAGKNLFNKNDITTNHIINSTGTVASSISTWVVSNIIPVEEREKYVANVVASSATAGTAFYKDGVFVSWISNDDAIANDKILTVPSEANQMRLTLTIVLLDTLQIEKGLVSTAYEAYRDTTELGQIVELLNKDQEIALKKDQEIALKKYVGKNIFNKETITPAKLIRETGVIGNATAPWAVSDLMTVEKNGKYIVSHIPPTATAGTAFYKDGVFVSWISNDDAIANDKILTVPSEANQMRLTIYDIMTGTLQVEKGIEQTNFEPYVELTELGQVAELLKAQKHGESILLNHNDLANYKKIADKSKYEIWKYNDKGLQIKAVHKDIVVRANATTIKIEDKANNEEYTVEYNATNFKDILEGTEINHVWIVPYTRNLTNVQVGANWRLVVVNTKGQIYHNYPSRAKGSDGSSLIGDIIRFDQSVVWDIEGRKHPSENPSATGVERYMPGLPSEVYKYYTIANTDPAFVDTYGNGGFDKSITQGGKTYSRFYEPTRGRVKKHSFEIMGTFEPDDKITMVATYGGNDSDGTRTCLFATDDGGRSWYTKYEFAGNNGIPNWANKYNTTGIVGDYTNGSFVIKKRGLNIPTNTEKEPSTPFAWGNDVVVSSITKANPAVITTETPHGLITGDVIIFKDNASSSSESTGWNWLRNDEATVSSGGNGVMFKVNVINTTKFELCDYIHSPFNNIPCRHVHHINRIKDGWIMGTGEVYPHGWLMYIQMKYADDWSVKRAYDSFDIFRLNSSQKSIQRTLGAILLDDNTFVAALDDALIQRGNIEVPEGRTFAISRSSTGIFKGSLTDIDDISKYVCIFEAREPAYYFKEHLGVWIFAGQRGEFGISFDKGENWSRERIDSSIRLFHGTSKNIIVVGMFVILLK